MFRLLKQNQLSIFLKGFLETFEEIEAISFNENVNGFYPDIRFSFMGIEFIIEIDEYQHKKGIAYSREREEKRTQALKNSFKTLVLIRINPDRSSNRPIPMISMTYNELSKQKEIIVNSGEVEHRQGEIEKVMRWVFLYLRQTRGRGLVGFTEYKLFFDH